MGDSFKLSKDKRHRSSSSLVGSLLEGTFSERKLDIRASIPEVDDHLAIAEARCDDLEKKIDLVKVLKRKRKLKKRSMTRIVDQPPTPENMPFITVRTQPKKSLLVTEVSQQAARLRRLEVPQNPTRGYLDPATIEQHRMIGQVRGYNQRFRQPNQQEEFNVRETTQVKPSSAEPKSYFRPRPRRAHAEGDNMVGQGVQINSDGPMEVACGNDEMIRDFNDIDGFGKHPKDTKRPIEPRNRMKVTLNRRKHVPKDVPTTKDAEKWQDNTIHKDGQEEWNGTGFVKSRRQQASKITNKHQTLAATVNQVDDSALVELFNKSRIDAQAASHPPINKRIKPPSKSLKAQRYENQIVDHLDDVAPDEVKKEVRQPRRVVKYRSRRYELPTVASQMKQSGIRYFYGNANQTNIPFVVSKSTAPSHNIGANIQQVLNGLKIQQPLSGIPLTIAHHMGLGHVPYYGTKSATVQPTLDNREINVIKVGDRLLRLPSYKYVSYNRLLSLYRQGEGMVPRFLRAINRPHYFYTSMYNLATNRDDIDGATSKGCAGNNEAKQSLAEYASLYREYEQIENSMKNGTFNHDMERRKDELSKQLAAREDHIRKVVQEYRGTGDVEQTTLRASASTTEDAYRSSTFKLNLTKGQQ